MGIINIFFSFLSKKKKKANIVCCGLDSSGKTTIINKLKPKKVSCWSLIILEIFLIASWFSFSFLHASMFHMCFLISLALFIFETFSHVLLSILLVVRYDRCIPLPIHQFLLHLPLGLSFNNYPFHFHSCSLLNTFLNVSFNSFLIQSPWSIPFRLAIHISDRFTYCYVSPIPSSFIRFFICASSALYLHHSLSSLSHPIDPFDPFDPPPLATLPPPFSSCFICFILCSNVPKILFRQSDARLNTSPNTV